MCNKTKHTCGDPNYATCITYEKELPDFTKIEDDCYTIDETTEDQYLILGDIKNEIYLSDLGKKCLSYVLDENDKIIVKNVLLKYEEEICNLKQEVSTLKTTSICNTSIESCNLDFGDLVDGCGEKPKTLKETLQLILNTINT